MKKLLALVLTGVMVFSLAACGSGKDTAATTTTDDTKTETTDNAAETTDTAADTTEPAADAAAVDLNVGVFYYTYSDTYISSVRTALDAALTEAGITFQNYDGNSNQTTQNEQIDTALSQGANLLIVNIVTSGSVDASQAIVDKASTAGVPVIFFNRAVESDDDEGVVLGSYDKCAFVGTDAPEAGHMQGKMIGEYLVENYDTVDLNGDGNISYAMFMGQLGNVVGMVDTLYSVMENFVVEYTIAGKTPHRAGNQDPSIAPFDSFRAKDADFVMGCGTNRMFAGLCSAMGREDLINDPRFVTNLDRCENYLTDLKPIIEAWTQTKTVAELEEIICGLSIPFGPILTIPEISEHDLVKERNMLWEVYQPGMEKTIRIPGTPIKIHGEEDKVQKGAPILGEDNVAIYTEVLGISAEEVKALEEKNVI